MIVKSIARFESTLPEDIIEDDDGYEIQFGGKSVAVAVAEMLRRLEAEVEGPEHAHEHGWTFWVQKDGRRFKGQITLIYGYWLYLDNPSWLDKILRRAPPAYLELLSGLDHALRADTRFSHVRWFATSHEAEYSPGPNEVR